MSRLINRLCGRVYGWFDSKEARTPARRLPATFRTRANLFVNILEDRLAPAQFTVTTAVDNAGGVNPAVGAGTGTLRQAIVDAVADPGSDEIIFDASFNSPQTITLLGNLPNLGSGTAGNNLIVSGPGQNLLTISGGFTKAGFATTTGAPGDTYTIKDLTIANCTAASGAGLSIGDEAVTVSNVTIRNCIASGDGAGINITAASPAALTLVNSTVRDNSATTEGGGIQVSSTALITVTNSTISGNTSNSDGGGLYFFSGINLDMDNSTVSGNTSFGTAGGGGIYLFGAVGALGCSIDNSTISGNTAATTNGGGIVIPSLTGTVTINNSTIAFNTAAVNGGGISHSSTGTVTIYNSIVSSNSVANPSSYSPDIRASGGTLNLDYSMIGVNSGFIAPGGANTTFGAALNLAPLAFNGGPTQTHRLNTGSAAIDAGDPVNLSVTDQRGLLRPVGAASDIGAFELQTNELPRISGNTIGDVITGGGATKQFTVTYSDETNINASTLGNDDVTVTYIIAGVTTTVPATIVGSPGPNANSITVTYEIPAPGGTWDKADYARYNVALIGEVKNVGGDAVGTGQIGRFGSVVRSTFTVTNANDTGAGSYRQAITDSNAQLGTVDTIVFDTGVFSTPQTISFATAPPTLTDGATITGPGSGLVTLQRTGATAMTILTLGAIGMQTFNISGLKIVGNTSRAVTLSDEIVTMNDINISGVSTASSGAAISVGANNNGVLNLSNGVITGNTSTATGSGGGGGIVAYNGANVTIDRTTISNNVASGNGGAINFNGTTQWQSLVITNSTLSGNSAKTTSATYGGGAINFVGLVGKANVLIRNSTISGNSAASNGGGVLFRVLNTAFNEAHIQNTTITGNSSNTINTGYGQGGGGVSVVSVSATTVVGVAPTGVLNIVSTILSGNASNAANGRDDLAANTTATLNSTNSAIGDIDGFVLSSSTNDLPTADASIANLKLGALALNQPVSPPPATTKTHAVLAGSKAVGAGFNPSNVTPALTVDQVGNARVQGAAIDIGSFERVSGIPSATLTTFVNPVLVNDGTTNPYAITVSYSDDDNVNRSTVGDAPDVTLTSPGGTVYNAVFVSAPAGNAPVINANYQLVPPGDGVWDKTDNGVWTISMLPSAVFNTPLGKAVPGGLLGTFLVNFANTYIVTNSNDSGAGSLRDVVGIVNSLTGVTHTIAFDPSFNGAGKTITLNSQLNVTTSVNITGPTGRVAVSGNKANRIFNIDDSNAGVHQLVTMKDLDLINASVAGNGGAISSGESLTLTDVTISGSTITGQGAGVFFPGNGPILTLLRTVITGNSASSNGGAMDIGPGGATVDITDSAFTNNKSSTGTIGLGYPTSFNMVRSTISGNSASGNGGGLRLFMGNGPHTIENSTISTNTAANGGGINIFAVGASASLLIRNSTITLNKATTNGGGINREATGNVATLNLDSTIVAGNINAATPDMNFATANQPIGGDYNLIGVADAGNFTPSGTFNQSGTKLTPLSAGIGGLANNGGFTQTHAVLPGGNAFNKGFNIAPALTTDQRGSKREDPTGLPDVGAFERTPGQPLASGGPYVNINAGNVATSNPYIFTVTYGNDANITYASLDNNDIRVTGPNGYNALAKFNGGVPSSDALSIVATYQVSAPLGGGWVGADNGTYTISVEAGQVMSGVLAVPAGAVGSFAVALPSTYLVTNANDSGAGSLRQAILNANANPATQDTLLFDTGFFNTSMKTITLASVLPTFTDNVIITGPGKSLATVNANALGRHFDLSGAPAGALYTISGLTLSGGNGVGNGGSIFVSDENLTLNAVTIENNTTSGNGGGVNVALAVAVVTVNDSLIQNNKATSYGGGISQSTTGAAVFVNNSTIRNNSSGANGGAIGMFFSGPISIINSTLSGNTAAGNFGGIYMWADVSKFLVSNSTIANNSTAGRGGGIGFNSSSGTGGLIRNSTITGNTASTTATGAGYGGGGLCLTGSAIVTVESSIVSGNFAANGRDDMAFNVSPNVNYSAIGDADGFTPSGSSANNLAFGEILLLGALGNNGGPTETILPGALSPVVDKGSNIAPALTTDQRGMGIDTVNYPRTKVTTDIGAVEVGFAQVPSAKLTNPLINVNADLPGTNNPYSFSVTYTDGVALNASTINNNSNAVLVTGPNGFNKLATFVSIDDNTNGTPRIATYKFSPPNGTGWVQFDNGSYTVTVQDLQVYNTTPGNPVPQTVIGSFNVGIPGKFFVTNNLDSGLGSLRDAIDAANLAASPDQIIFDPAYFNPSKSVADRTIFNLSPLPTVIDALDIIGPSGAGSAPAFVDGSGIDRVLDVSGAPAKTAISISNLTFQNGSAIGAGGGLLIGDEYVTLTGVSILNNIASAQGGGIAMITAGAQLTVIDSTIAANSAGSTSVGGGGISASPNGSTDLHTVTVTNSVINSNTSGGTGGGISFWFDGTLVMSNSSVTNNTSNAGNGGGAVYMWGTLCKATISNSTIANNSAAGQGGGFGLFNGLGATMSIRNSTLSGNSSASATTTSGGGIANGASWTLSIESSIVAGNSSGSTAVDLGSNTTVALNFSAVGDPNGFTSSGNVGNIAPGTDLKLGALQDNNYGKGYTGLTILPGSGSPLINAGSNPVPALSIDQRGFSRTVGASIDIGAVEVQPFDNTAPTVLSFQVNNGDTQRSRITSITVTFSTTVSPAAFTGLGAITLTRTAATPTGTIGTIVQTGATGNNGLITPSQPGPGNQLVLTFSNADGADESAGVEYGSLSDGRWQLAIPSAGGYASTPGDTELRRLFGDFEGAPGSNGTVDGADFGTFGAAFGSSGAPGFSPFDYDNNGTIDSVDLGAIGARFGFTV